MTKTEVAALLLAGTHVGFYRALNSGRVCEGFIRPHRELKSMNVNARWLADLPDDKFDHWREGTLTMSGVVMGVARRTPKVVYPPSAEA